MNELPVQTWKITVSPLTQAIQIEPIFFECKEYTLDQISDRLPGGAYTTFRTYFHTQVYILSRHFHRLEESAQLAGIPVQVQWAVVRDHLRSIVGASPLPELRCRITLDLSQQPGDVYISIEPLHVPSALQYEQGVTVMTEKMQRSNPMAKLTNFISIASQTREHLPEGVHEVLMLDAEGDVLEGLSSNFFGIVDGTLSTAHDGVLLGMTRSLVIEAAQNLAIPLKETALNIHDVTALDEAFITSASRGVLPVTQIQPYIIGSGKPGPVTEKIRSKFDEILASRLEEI